jgi:WD40 repeat protein
VRVFHDYFNLHHWLVGNINAGDSLSLAWNPDGQKIALASLSQITIIELSSGNTLPRYSSEIGNLISSAWNPDGSKLAGGNLSGETEIWNTTSHEIIATLVGHTQAIVSISWNVDGAKLATASLDGTIRIWDTVTWQTTTMIQNENAGSPIYSVAWRPDGHQLAYAGGGDVPFFEWVVPSVEDLKTQVNLCLSDQGTRKSLEAKIKAGSWQAFINEVNAQKGKKISVDCADQLIEITTYLLNHPSPTKTPKK